MNKFGKAAAVFCLSLVSNDAQAGGGHGMLAALDLAGFVRPPDPNPLNVPFLRRSPSAGDLFFNPPAPNPLIRAGERQPNVILPAEVPEDRAAILPSIRPTTLLDLPREMIETIATFLGGRGTTLLAATGSALRWLVFDRELWRFFRRTELRYDLEQTRPIPMDYRLTRFRELAEYQMYRGEMFYHAGHRAPRHEAGRYYEQAIALGNPNAMMAVAARVPFFYGQDGRISNEQAREARRMITLAMAAGHPEAYVWSAQEARGLNNRILMLRLLNQAIDHGSDQARQQMVDYYNGAFREFPRPAVAHYIAWLGRRFASDPEFYTARIRELLSRGRPTEGLPKFEADQIERVLASMRTGKNFSEALEEIRQG